MKKVSFLLVFGALAFSLCVASPVSLFAEEYSLDDLYRIALDRSEILKVAEENLAIAEIGKEKALSYLLPRLTATGGLTHYSQKKFSDTGGVIQPEYGSSWRVQLDQTVSTSGRELTALGISRQFVTKSAYDVTAIREDYFLRFVASAYYNVLMARKVLEIADSNVERLSRYRDAAAKRLRIGEVTKTALLRAEGELSGAKSDRLQAQNSLELAMAVLERNIGIRDVFTIRDEAETEGDIPALDVFRERAFSMRAELKSMEVQKQIAADQTKYVEGAFWPTVSAFAGYAGAEQHPASSNMNRESIYGGVALNFLIFEGGLRKAEVSEAKARERQAALFYEDLKKGIAIEVQTAYLDLVTQKGILHFLDDQVAFARDNYRAVARQFDFGLANSLDILDANTLLVSAETKVASAHYNYRLALLRMKKAAGTLLSNES